MKGLYQLKKLLRKGDFMVKLNLKYVFSSVPLHMESRKYVRLIEWKRSQICIVLFWIEPSSTVFYKTSKSTDVFNK